MKEKCKIYLLQGNLFYSHIFKQNLINLGYRDVSSFNTIAECINHLDDMPDIIFYDYDVDFLDGEDVLKMIKKFYPEIYVLFSCAAEESGVVPKFLQHGAFDYFIKGQDEMRTVEELLINIIDVKKQLRRTNFRLFSKVKYMVCSRGK